MFRRVLVFMTVSVAAGSLFAQAQDAKFDLAKKPAFRPGDTVKITATSDAERTTTDGNKTVENGKESIRTSEVDEVLAVDASGMPTEIRVTIQSAEMDETATDPRGQKQTKKTTLRDVALTRKKDGDRFAWDTTSIVAKEPNALSAAQIALLKQLQGSPEDWDVYPQNDVILMPKLPVAVGATWSPSAEDLKKWVAGDPKAKALSASVRGAGFKLASASGTAATVDGNLACTASLNGMEMNIEFVLHSQIDTASGRWTQTDQIARMTGRMEKITAKMEGAGKAAMDYTAGDGKPSTGPAWTNKIGWAKPSADTNSFKDKEHGVSLDVPKDAKPVTGQAGYPLIAVFRLEEAGGAITITALRTPVLGDLEAFSAGVVEGTKKAIAGYKVVRQSGVTLSNNVPAVLVVATGLDGKQNIVTLTAQDGKKFISASLLAPVAAKVTVDDLIKIAKTLRSNDEEE